MSYNSKYKGSEVDNLLSSIKDKQDVIPDLVTIREGSSKGATALQEEQYKGTVTSVKINGTTKTPDTNGMVDLGTIEGGSGSSSGGNGAYAEINHGSNPIGIIAPNVFHVFEDPSFFDFVFGDEQEGVVNEYILQISFTNVPIPAIFPDTIQWANGEPIFKKRKTYQISIVNNIGLIVIV